MNNHLWMKNPIRINLATVYNAFREKPFSFFLMVIISISVYKYLSTKYSFIFELSITVISLIISLTERKKINKLMISDKDSSNQIRDLVETSFNTFGIYSLIGWTYLILGLINTNFYLVLSSIMCIYFIGILTRRVDPYFDY